jgi:hypothetical protein
MIMIYRIYYSAESSVDVTEGNGCDGGGGGGVSYDNDTRLYKSGVNDRVGVEKSNLGGG